MPDEVTHQGVTGSFAAPGQACAAQKTDAEEAGKLRDTVVHLQHKVKVSEEVVEQLKSLIRAQHAKIEELCIQVQNQGNPAMQMQTSSPTFQWHVFIDAKRGEEMCREDYQQLETKVQRLTNQTAELKWRNADLRRTNKRYAAMVAQGVPAGWQATAEPTPRSLGASTRASPTPCACVPAPGPPAHDGRPSVPAPSEAGANVGALPARHPMEGVPWQKRPWHTMLQAPSHFSAASPQGGECQGVLGRRFALVSRSLMSLLHGTSPRVVKRMLLHGVAQMLEGLPVGLTLYVADPWLRSVMADCLGDSGSDQGLALPTTFYLAEKVTLHAYRQDGRKADPPRFPDLASLPICGTGAVLALPLQAGLGKPILGALQVVTACEGGEASRSPRAAHGPGRAAGGAVLNLSDSQATGVELLCHTAAGILDMRRSIEFVKAVQGRARDCLAITAEVHGAHTLSDFEQRAKPLMNQFFNVASSRFSFYDKERQELVTTALRAHRRGETKKENATGRLPAVGQRNLVKSSVQNGIVGRCVRKRDVLNVDRMITCPYVSETADGVSVCNCAGDVNMLAGPMVANLSDGTSQVVGVLQLIEKKRRSDEDALGAFEHAVDGGRARGVGANAGAGPQPRCDAFTPQDEDFFRELLRILGLAAYRTMQVQGGFGPVNVERLLAGPLGGQEGRGH